MKKFIKKLAKKAEGFTLVELVVVIAILGILAGVAVPAYSGYLSKAKEASDINQLDAIMTASQAALAKQGSVVTITVNPTGSNVTAWTVDVADDDDDVKFVLNAASGEASEATDYNLYMGSNSIKLESEVYKKGAKWTSADGWKGATIS